MTEYRRSRPRDWHERAYRLLLHAYPGSFRQEFGDAMLEFFRDRLSNSRESFGRLGVAEVWSAALLDVMREATLAWLDSAAARGMGKARQRLVVTEVALAVITLSGAGLMLRSLWNLQAIDLGFRPENVVTLQVAPPPTEYQGDRSTQFYHSVLERVRTVPGVRSAAAVADLPVADGNSIWSILLDGAPMTSVAQSPSAMPQVVTPGYFETMRIPLLRGRVIADADDAKAPMVALVNESMVRKYWPNRDPLGRTIRMLSDGSPWATVVGVVKDVRSGGFLGEIPPTTYFPHAQAGKSAYYTPSLMNLVVRTGRSRGCCGRFSSMCRRGTRSRWPPSWPRSSWWQSSRRTSLRGGRARWIR